MRNVSKLVLLLGPSARRVGDPFRSVRARRHFPAIQRDETRLGRVRSVGEDEQNGFLLQTGLEVGDGFR
jgi:hypothetical protein